MIGKNFDNEAAKSYSNKLCSACISVMPHSLHIKELPFEVKDSLEKLAIVRHFEPGQTIFTIDAAPFFANLVSGVVKLSKSLPDGRQQIVGLQFPPNFIGCPFGNKVQIIGVAVTPVTVQAFAAPGLSELFARHPELEHCFLAQILDELDQTRDWLLTIGRKTASERMAELLYLIASQVQVEEHNKNGVHEATFDLPLNRTDIADFLGLTIETVSRQLSKFKRQGLVEIHHCRHVTIKDMAALHKLSGSH